MAIPAIPPIISWSQVAEGIFDVLAQRSDGRSVRKPHGKIMSLPSDSHGETPCLMDYHGFSQRRELVLFLQHALLFALPIT